MSGTTTAPSHSPAKVLMVAKDFCASDSTGATEGFCASDCAKAKAENNSSVIGSIRQRDFMIILLELSKIFGPGADSRFTGEQPSPDFISLVLYLTITQ